ncbi:MAG: hypothetical protein K2X66_10710, partial [Cyanobacteria bacterium]|nr:hypothetical protein [Cyanobacteriota bacterium]
RFLDIGIGEGTYSRFFRSLVPNSQWVGIEAWGPYLEQFSLSEKYDQIVLSDARYVDWTKLGRFDVAFMGDVLEHMTLEESKEVYEQVSNIARFCIISIPVVHMPQGAELGNPFEIHVKDDWTHGEVMETFPFIQSHTVDRSLGVYIAAKNPEDQALLQKRNQGYRDLARITAEWRKPLNSGMSIPKSPSHSLSCNNLDTTITSMEALLGSKKVDAKLLSPPSTPAEMLAASLAKSLTEIVTRKFIQAGIDADLIQMQASVISEQTDSGQSKMVSYELDTRLKLSNPDPDLIIRLVTLAKLECPFYKLLPAQAVEHQINLI